MLLLWPLLSASMLLAGEAVARIGAGVGLLGVAGGQMLPASLTPVWGAVQAPCPLQPIHTGGSRQGGR